MYNYNITAQEISDYIADMAEMAGSAYFPSDEKMEEMAKYLGENELPKILQKKKKKKKIKKTLDR